MILNWLTVSLGVALVALFVGKRAKIIRWTLFALYLTFLSWMLWTTYGMWDYRELYPIFSLAGVNFYLSFSITPLRWFFALFTTVINLVIAIFSIRKNLEENDELGIGTLWILLAASNLMIFVANDWITLFIAWEIMTWTSYFIITPGWKNSFRAANYYFLLSMFGAYSMLIAIWWMHALPGVNSFDISATISAVAELWVKSPFKAGMILALVLAGFLSKSAVFPFHPWPAEAHAEAPDDFSPYLSGIMIKYGLYGVVLFVAPVFIKIAHSETGSTINGVPVYSYILAWIGAITAVVGTYRAIIENDMKRLAAWSTVANVGYIATALFILTPLGITGGIFHIFNHAIFKGMIFLALAAVKFRTHERQMHRLGGLAYKMPITFLTFLTGIIAAAGIPPMNGYASKWLIYQALLVSKFPFLTLMIFVASTGAFMYLFRALHSIFLGQLPERLSDVKEVPIIMQIPMIIGILTMMFFGVFPGYALKPIGEIVSSMGLTPIRTTPTTMFSVLSVVDATKVGGMFGLSFLIAFVLFLVGKKRRYVDMLDNYTAGQNPKDFGLTTEMYHFAYKFYEPFANMFSNIKINFKKMYDVIAKDFNLFGEWISSLFDSPTIVSTMVFVGTIVILIIAGWSG